MFCRNLSVTSTYVFFVTCAMIENLARRMLVPLHRRKVGAQQQAFKEYRDG
jgi:hypothetical protein